MASPRLLVSWIGHADLAAMAPALSAKRQERLSNALEMRRLPQVDEGPIRTLVQRESFDEIHLLSNYPSFLGQWHADWLAGPVSVHQVEIENPTDYPSIFRAADSVLQEVARVKRSGIPDLCIHLSPGTPAMTAIWVLLGKSRYPARFFQTHSGQAWETDIPFDLAVDFVPDFLHAPDRSLLALASRSPQEIPGFTAIVGNSKPNPLGGWACPKGSRSRCSRPDRG